MGILHSLALYRALPPAVLLLAAAILTPFTALRAQDVTASPARQESRIWYGGFAGLNFNFFGGQITSLDQANPVVGPFTAGSGVGLHLGGLVEYNSGKLLGGNAFLGYDNRSVSFSSIRDSATGQTRLLSTSHSYLSLDPNLRINLMDGKLHGLVGLSFGIALSNGYSYTTTTAATGTLNNSKGLVTAFQFGAGYDYALTKPAEPLQMLVTPYAILRVGQSLVDATTANSNDFRLTTFRLGAEIKLSRQQDSKGTDTTLTPGDIDFALRAPNVVTQGRHLSETFPLRNYIFFDPKNPQIPDRYARLTPDAAAQFREDQLSVPVQNVTGGPSAPVMREERQMQVYYNALNVLGDRMRSNPGVQIRLIGAANGNATAGKEMAENVKNYLVTTFGIDTKRISTEGDPLPPNKSGSGVTTGDDARLVGEENSRVTVIGPDEILRPVHIETVQEEPIDNDVVVSIPGDSKIASWTVNVTSADGRSQMFGPYHGNNVARILPISLLDKNDEGNYTARITAITPDGKSLNSGTRNFRLVRGDADEDNSAKRYSILFEFDESKTVQTYSEFLTKVVAPSIPNAAIVVIHGHTDIVGDPEYNNKLSQRRVTETESILSAELKKANKFVTFDTYGFGEDETRSPFNNTLPEQRYYNRTVVIEVVTGE